MPNHAAFDLDGFLPYLLNQAAEATSQSFHATYKAAYGMTRTQWRVLANLGKFGSMTARDICSISHEEKTKVSRAVSALADAGFLARTASPQDGRAEVLSLTDSGRAVFADLGRQAKGYDAALREQIGPDRALQLEQTLRLIISTAGNSVRG